MPLGCVRSSQCPNRLRKLAALAVGLALPAVAFAGQVKGKLLGLDKLMNPVWQEARDVGSHRFSWREPSPTVRSEFRSLFAYAPKEVCVVALASSAQQPPALPLLITVGGGRTTPVTVVVAPGTRLHFENRDPFAHKLYGVGQTTFPPAKWRRSRRATGPRRGRVATKSATSSAPSIRSWVIVDSNVAAIAYPNTQGVFNIQPLPPGEYTLKVFFAGNPVGTPKTFMLGGANVDVALPVHEGASAKLDAGAGAGERD